MKYIALILVSVVFYWFLSEMKTPTTGPVYVGAKPGELSAVEKEYYIKVFDYAMTTAPDNTPYEWKSSDFNNGSIVANVSFTSKSSARCRRFKERFAIGKTRGEHEGIACKRVGNAGWCRLKLTDALTCALEKSGSYVFHNMPGGGSINIPTVNIGGGIGSVGIPAGGSSGGGTNMPAGTSGGSSVDAPEAPTGQSYADTVTGTAGSAAGPATSGMRNWFNSTFR